MAKYKMDQNRGRTLHLLVANLEKQSTNRNGGVVDVCVDITSLVNDGLARDRRNGYDGIGPMAAHEIEKGREYADYVASHATVENLFMFSYKGCYCFTNRTS